MTHKYQVRQLVRLSRPSFSDSRASTSGFYEVTRLMPADQIGEFSSRPAANAPCGKARSRHARLTIEPRADVFCRIPVL